MTPGQYDMMIADGACKEIRRRLGLIQVNNQLSAAEVGIRLATQQLTLSGKEFR